MSNYLEELEQLTNKLQDIKKLAVSNSFKSIAEKCNNVIQKIDKNQFVITVVGEFNRGKSTFINALLGVDIIPTAIRPTTATINIIHYGKTPAIRVHKSNGEVISLNFSVEALTDYTSLVDFSTKSVKYIEVAYPLEYLKDGTTIVDTPGVNDMDEQRLDVTYGYMPNSDAVIFLFDIEAPFRQTEKIFLTEKILKNNIAQMFFVANKSDRIDESDISESISEIQKQLTILFPEQKFEVYPLAAKKALKNKIKRKENDASSESFEHFETELKEFILGSDKFEAKLQSFNNQLNEIISLFVEDIKIELANLDLSIDGLLDAKEKLNNSKGKYKKAFEKLLKYIDEQNAALKQRVESSLIKNYKNKEELFLKDIKSQNKDLSTYSKERLSYNIDKSLKSWVEQSQPFIEQNVNIIISKSLEGYKKYFSKIPLFNNLQNKKLAVYDKIESIELSDEFSPDKIDLVVKIAGGLLIGGLAIITGGTSTIFTIPAFAGINFGTGKLIKKQHEDQKVELLEKLPGILNKAYEALRKNTLHSLDSIFENFKKNLDEDFDKTFKEIKESIDEALRDKDNKKEVVTEKKIQLKKLITTINNLEV